MGGPARTQQQSAGQGKQGHTPQGAHEQGSDPQSRAAFQDYLSGLDEGGHAPGAAGEDALHDEAPTKKSDALLDLSGVVTVGAVQTALNLLANEPGERGELAFEMKLSANLGSAARVKASAWGELKLSYSVNDQNYCVIALEAAVAGRLGIDVAGWGVGVELGYEKDFLNSWFKGSQPAAEWVLEQIRALNEVVGGGFIDFGDGGHGKGGDGHEGGPDWSVHESTVSAGAYAEGSLGENFQGEVAGRLATTDQSWHDDEHNVIETTVDHRKVDAEFSVKALGRGPFHFEYHYDWSDTHGSPIYYTNGIFAEHTLSVGATFKELFGRRWGSKKPPVDSVQNLVVNGFGMVEKLMPFRWAKQLNYKLFSSVVDEIHKAHPGRASADLRFHVEFNWNEYGETDGDLNLMYFRVKVKPEMVIELAADAVVGELEVGASMSKSEVVFEHIGSETVTYIQRQYVFETDDRPWAAFKASNRKQIYELVENCATPGFDYYEASVERAFVAKGGKDYEAALTTLEQHWDREKALTDGIRADCAKIAVELGEATSMFTWFDSTKQSHMDNIYTAMVAYGRDAGTMQFLFEMLPMYGVNMKELKSMMEKFGHTSTYARLRQIALQAEKKPS